VGRVMVTMASPASDECRGAGEKEALFGPNQRTDCIPAGGDDIDLR